MKKCIRNVYRVIRDILMLFCKLIVSIVPKDTNLFLFTAWFGERYSDNTMFLYEYFMKETNHRVMWITKNKKVYEMLKAVGKPVVMRNSLGGIWNQIRAKVVFSTIQINDHNPFLLSRCIFVDLDHGIIFKQVGYDIDKNNTYIERHDKIAKMFVDYYMTTPSYLTHLMMKHSYHIDEKHLLLCSKARLDYLFDETRWSKTTLINSIHQTSKTIVYMPTHRSCGAVTMNVSDILDLEFIDSICEEYGYTFVIKKHFYHKNEKEKLSCYRHIIDLTGEEIDAQDMLVNADILISDYSSAYIDYLLLNRPLVLYTYDLENYLEKERGLFVPFDKLDIGYQPKTKSELNDTLLDVLTNKADRYFEKRKNVKKIYFDESLKNGQACKGIEEIVTKLISCGYTTDWETIRYREEKRNGVKELSEYIVNM